MQRARNNNREMNQQTFTQELLQSEETQKRQAIQRKLEGVVRGQEQIGRILDKQDVLINNMTEMERDIADKTEKAKEEFRKNIASRADENTRLLWTGAIFLICCGLLVVIIYTL